MKYLTTPSASSLADRFEAAFTPPMTTMIELPSDFNSFFGQSGKALSEPFESAAWRRGRLRQITSERKEWEKVWDLQRKEDAIEGH